MSQVECPRVNVHGNVLHGRPSAIRKPEVVAMMKLVLGTCYERTAVKADVDRLSTAAPTTVAGSCTWTQSIFNLTMMNFIVGASGDAFGGRGRPTLIRSATSMGEVAGRQYYDDSSH